MSFGEPVFVINQAFLFEIVLETIIWFRNLQNLLVAFWIIFQMKLAH